jgi:uncharacterized membrane protein (DUF4010 family)
MATESCQYHSRMTDAQQTFYYQSVALAIGLLIGIERGWKARDAKEGERVAGVRTYGLIGLLGGGVALISSHLGSLVMGLALVGFAGALTAVYVVNLRTEEDVGITSLVAGLVTFVLGGLAAAGEVAIAAASAVVATLLLSYKPVLHHWLNALEAEELRAGIKLLLISVVLLPILPNRGYGPWQALNPYAIWWMVVLIAAISFIGYFAVKIGGPRRGIVFTGLFGGLASSTALSLHFSRMACRNPASAPILAMGTLLACGTMFPRIVLLATLINPGLFARTLVPSTLMALLVYVPALLYWRSQTQNGTDTASTLKNPLELRAAMTFGTVLALVLLLGNALRTWFGDAGVLVLAAASGITDVDAITLSLSGMSRGNLPPRIATMGVVIAACVNNFSKAGMVAVIGGRDIGIRVGIPLCLSALGGIISTWLWLW